MTLVLLTGDTTNFKFTKPGAISKARWMAKAIYTIYMYLLSDKITSELPKDTIFTPYQIERIGRFVKFVSLIYIKWWVKCPVSVDSPINDLAFLTSIRSYSDCVISSAAEKAMQNHMWYLTEELVPLSLFSP